MGKIKVVDSNGNWRDADWRPNVGGSHPNVRSVHVRTPSGWRFLYGVRQVTISGGTNVNLRDEFENTWGDPTSNTVVEFIVTGTIGSNSTSRPALEVGGWPGGAEIKLINQGEIIGCGGDGGNGGDAGYEFGEKVWGNDGGDGENGGVAVQTRHSIAIDNRGLIGGGGGGGGGSGGAHMDRTSYPATGTGAGGGGGAGSVSGSGGSSGSVTNRWATDDDFDRGMYYCVSGDGSGGDTRQGGSGGSGCRVDTAAYSTRRVIDVGDAGNGGDLGGPGIDAGGTSTNSAVSTEDVGSSGSGGSAGPAIDGISFVTFERRGDARGPTTDPYWDPWTTS